MKRFFLFLLIVPFLASCNDDDQCSLDDYMIDIATVENPNQATNFYFTLDDGERMWTAASELKYYRPKDGQRIIANYTILAERPASSTHGFDVRLNDAYEVLTKGIFNITPATQDSIGNDYISIRDMWICSDYLNVEFEYPGYNKTHFINLVSDTSKTYTDGKVHLEFRHNDNGDYPNYFRWGIVSFNLRSLQTSPNGSIGLVIHTKEFNLGEETYNLTYKFGTNASMVKHQKISIKPERAIMQ